MFSYCCYLTFNITGSKLQYLQDLGYGNIGIWVIQARKAVKEDFPNIFISNLVLNYIVDSSIPKTLEKRKATEELAVSYASDKRPYTETRKDKNCITFKDSQVGKSENTRVL